MWHKRGTEHQETKAQHRLLQVSAQAIFKPPLDNSKTKKTSSLFLACALSLLFHLVLLVITGPALKKLDVEPKKSLEATLSFKPVITTVPKNTARPKKARFYAEQDQSAKREHSAPISNTPAFRLKSHKNNNKIKSAKDFLAKNPSKNDPLGLKLIPRADHAQASKHQQKTLTLGEHVPGVAEGDHTELNAWVWRHATFFNRIKAQIGQVWAPNAQIARFDPQGALLGQQDRVTVMSVTIDPEGKLKAAVVANSSGVAYLDEEAERAFRKAAPFPFPPKDLFDNPDGFTFHFAFHLQLNRGMKFDFEW